MAKSWLEKLGRNAGLMIHNITRSAKSDIHKKEINRTVEEKQVDDKMILRRTTIDEVEIRKNIEGQ